MAGKNVLPDESDLYVKNGSTEFQVVSSTGQLYHKGTALTPTAAEINNLSAAYTVTAETTTANLAANGISTLTWSTGGDPAYTLAAPAVGVEKVLVLFTTAAVQDSTAIFTSVYTGSTAIFIANPSTAYAANLYAGFQPPFTALTLVGLTTARWGVKALQGGVKFSTNTTFSS